MSLGLTDIKNGVNVLFNNEPYVVVSAQFVRMQQRKPVMQTKLKNLINGKVVEYNFKSGEKVEQPDLERGKANYLYKDENNAYFMDNNSFEQFSLSLGQIGDKINFLKDGAEVDVLYFEKKAVNLVLPTKVELKVTAAEPAVRGDSAQGRVTKRVTLETGATINAPLFIKEGETIRVNTETGEYVERV